MVILRLNISIQPTLWLYDHCLEVLNEHVKMYTCCSPSYFLCFLKSHFIDLAAVCVVNHLAFEVNPSHALK